MERNAVSDLVWEIEPHLAGQPPFVQGAVLADLLATGGAARARNLSAEQKQAIGRKGAAKRWGTSKE